MQKAAKKLWQVIAILFGCAVVFVLAHDLYSAALHHRFYVYGRLASWLNLRGGLVSYDKEPIAFWAVVIFEIFALVALIAFAVFGIREERKVATELHRRSSRRLVNAIQHKRSER